MHVAYVDVRAPSCRGLLLIQFIYFLSVKVCSPGGEKINQKIQKPAGVVYSEGPTAGKRVNVANEALI